MMMHQMPTSAATTTTTSGSQADFLRMLESNPTMAFNYSKANPAMLSNPAFLQFMDKFSQQIGMTTTTSTSNKPSTSTSSSMFPAQSSSRPVMKRPLEDKGEVLSEQEVVKRPKMEQILAAEERKIMMGEGEKSSVSSKSEAVVEGKKS